MSGRKDLCTRLENDLEMSTVRDRLWLWGHDAGAHNDGWGLPKPSRITPAEAAFYLGIPNLIMVRYRGRPATPFDQYALPFRSLKQVVWSVVGAGGRTDQKERQAVLALASRNRNISGVMLDDFFGAESSSEGKSAALSLAQLRQVRGRLRVRTRRLDLWAVLYDTQLDKPLGKYLELLDILTFWTWDSRNLKALEGNWELLENAAPRCGKLLGCYMWDYGEKRPLRFDAMKHQCELGLEWLGSGKIEGMIFLASCICDLELKAVEWVREWIAGVGDRRLDGIRAASRQKMNTRAIDH